MALKKLLHGLLQLLCLLSVSLANEENYLHTGCAPKLSLHDILEDSLTIHLKYPPENEFTLEVKQGDNKVELTYSHPGVPSETPEWTAMDLVMEGVPQIKFQNGTTWLSGDPGREFKKVPAKEIYLSEGFLPNCPQELPNWNVHKNMSPKPVIMENGEEEVFSLISSQETILPFRVGEVNLRLCWNAVTSSTVVLVVSDSSSECSSLPPSTLLWLKVSYRGYKVELSDPSRPDVPELYRPFHMMKEKLKVCFLGNGVRGLVSVVHHLKGYPDPQGANSHHHAPVPATDQATPARSSTQSDPKANGKDMCEVISIVTGIFAILLILILCLLTALFYNRWINARQILILLKNSTHSRSDITVGGKPSLPSRPPPTLKPVAEDNYLTPKELFGDEERPKSELIYEDMLPHGWAPKLPGDDVSKTNKAFQSPENDYAVPRKINMVSK